MGPYFFRNPYSFYPFSGFYRPQYGYYNKYQNDISHNQKNDNKKNQPDEFISQNSSDFNQYKKPIFELFGIKLFFDDVLIISLIFFLYNEGVKDQSLFIALILLLLS